MDNSLSQAPADEFVMFSSEDGNVRIECRFEGDTLWLSQAMICKLYGKAKATISEHIKNIFAEEELEENSVVRFYRTTANDGKSYNTQFFSLPLILAVGYRVRSSRGTQFRKWATRTLEEYMVKGFVMDDERLKNPPVGSSVVPDYFDEMLDRIRDIRASERRMYLRIRDIFSLAADYEPSLQETTQFFKIIQNKLHYACSGQTAPELIYHRANAEQPNMGLNTFKGPTIRKGDIAVAKNYLNEREINELNRIVSMWLDFAEDQARRRTQVFLKDWQQKLDQFLQFNDREVLSNAGKISSKQAKEKAQIEYDLYTQRQRQLKEHQGEQEINALLQWQSIRQSKDEQ